jgi:hypothetical protein
VPAGQADGPEAATFRRLVERNTRNMQPPRWATGVLESGAGDWEVRVAVDALLAKVGVKPARGGRMSAPRKALLLVGSPKPGDSTSGSLGGYLLEELEKRGVATETIRVTKAVRTEEATEGLLAAVASADLVVFSFPLYVDSLPAPAIRALELIAEGRAAATDAAASEADAAGSPDPARLAFVAICQSGFPEADHNEVAVEICRNFARDAGLEWAGGLVLAAGGMVGGQPLRKLEGMMRSAVKSLDLTAEALAAGRQVPDEAVQLMAKPPIPKIGYRFMADWGWRSMFKKQGGSGSLKDQPYA